MKLSSPHLSTVNGPSILDVARAIDELEGLKIAEPEADEYFVLIDTDDGTGAFIQAVCVDDHPHWRVEVCNSDEASLRALRDPVTRGRAVELLSHFVQGDRSMGNGQEWVDVDVGLTRRSATPVAFALGVLTLLAAATGIWFLSR
jgi:hypothetical protein